jgi:polar amino acid transport system substrate-binding protein
MKSKYYFLILKGFAGTLEIVACSMIISLFLGMLIAAVRAHYQFSSKLRFLNCFAVIFVNIIRGTPVMLQLLIMAYIVLVQLKSVFLVAVITFGLNSSAYVSEILRSGIKGVPTNQYTAGAALGFKNTQIINLIIFPQALRNSLPSLLNEFSALLKETAIVGIIGFTDITHAASIIRSTLFSPIMPFLIVGAIYFAISSVASYCFEKIEQLIATREGSNCKKISAISEKREEDLLND